MRVEGTIRTADSVRRDGLAAVDFRGQARAVLAQGPAEVGGRHGGEWLHAGPRNMG